MDQEEMEAEVALAQRIGTELCTDHCAACWGVQVPLDSPQLRAQRAVKADHSISACTEESLEAQKEGYQIHSTGRQQH